MRGPRILLVNDDGYAARGLAELEAVAREISDDVWLVAPDGERSGASHSISLSDPTRVKQLNAKRFAVKGTPADCVILAVWNLMSGSPPALVLSGINHGENLGDDLLYSGTTGAAMEASILGIPCVAFSQVRRNFGTADFRLARYYAPRLLRRLLDEGLAPDTFLNINFPDGRMLHPEGIHVLPAGRRARGTFTPVQSADGRNVPHYWTKVIYDAEVPEEGTDLAGIRDGAITITPLTVDLTDRQRLEHTRGIFAGMPIGAVEDPLVNG